MIWDRIMQEHIIPANIVLTLLFGRILFAAFALSFLVKLIMSARKKLAPSVRSWLWGLCVPALIIPFEHSALVLAKRLDLPSLALTNIFYELWQPILSYLWLAGFIASLVQVRANNKRTLYLLHTRQLRGCAAYFHKGHSSVYLPPDFMTIYTQAEQDMLLAHERQHILQHDPYLYRILSFVKCIFWFNPLIHQAIHLIKQDRELLCDERAIQGRCRIAYGSLLLREARTAMPGYEVAGIVSEAGDIYERIAACAVPFPQDRKKAVMVACIAVIIFSFGFVGFLYPAMESPMRIQVFLTGEASVTPVEGAEKYAMLERDVISLDQNGLFEYALSMGLRPEQSLYVSVVFGRRPTLTSFSTVSNGFAFAIHELQTELLRYSHHQAGLNLWSVLYRIL